MAAQVKALTQQKFKCEKELKLDQQNLDALDKDLQDVIQVLINLFS